MNSLIASTPALLAAGAALAALCLPSSLQAQTSCSGKDGQPGVFDLALQTPDGRTRTYILTVPSGYDGSEPAPMIFDFHGWGSTGAGQAERTAMAAKAGAEGYLVVHADGIENSWNAGSCCGVATVQDIDDVQFVREMVEAISDNYCVDASRIHSTGFSNGGYFSHRLACEANDIIASVAPVSGPLGVDCNPERPVSLLQVTGTADALVWYGSVENSVAEWADINGCEGEPSSYYSRGNVDCVAYDGCDGGSELEFCSLRGVTHRWVDSRWFDTTEEIIDFFQANPMP